MSRGTIWILTDTVWEPVADRVAGALETRNRTALVLTPDAASDVVVEVGGTALSVTLGTRKLELPDAVLYLRDPIPDPAHDATLGADERSFVAQQWQIMLRGLVTALEMKGVPVANPVSSVLVDEKTAQLLRAAELGFATPPTLHGASGAHADRFAAAHGDRCAVKPFAPFVRLGADGSSAQRLLTNLTNADNLRRGLDTASVASPTIVQPFVCAPFEHRVVVVGDAVFSARIARAGATAIDVRRLAPTHATITIGDLPSEVRQRCVRLVESFGLSHAAIDLLERADGSHVFLDLNPSGHFLWVEQLTGAPICAAIADRLMQLGAGSGQVATLEGENSGDDSEHRECCEDGDRHDADALGENPAAVVHGERRQVGDGLDRIDERTQSGE